LANNGADINREIVENVTPLTVATLRGQPELVEYLFGLGATPPTRPGTAHTLISWHRREINVVYPILSSLLLHGLDANSRDTFGSTLLHVAAYTTPEDPRMEMVVKLLLTVGADVNAKNQDQETSLDLALGRSPVYAPVVHVLLEHGAQRGDGTSPTAEELGLPPKQAE
jgi:ankyrin repeat protein